MATGEEVTDASNSDEKDFPHFDILSGDSVYSDHHYRESNNSDRKNNNTNKKIKQWKILEGSLPESIYVRAYEDRMDLLRAVIIGTGGTPYHDGLFFFDVALPPDYPKRHPQVRFPSHGMSLNPNLYESGVVCLSLLNTWTGSGVELWRPGKSTILQPLVSLQGLVLHENPIFNEPSPAIRSKLSMSEIMKKASVSYNEVAFMYSCKMMMCKMRNPPKGFEGFVVEHFRNRGEFVLAAVLAYANGEAVIGSSSVVEVSE